MTPHDLYKLFPDSTHAQLGQKLGVSTSTVSAWFHREAVPERIELKIQVMYPKLWRQAQK
jgi:hypothetical protein